MKKIGIDRLTITLLYNKHKDYIVPIVIIIVCFLLFVKITIPQLNSLSKSAQEVKIEKDKLDILKNNLNFLTSLNEGILDSQLSVTSDALPPGKNFAEILNTVSISANKSGVFLGDFEFQVGDLSKTTTPPKGLPSLQLSLITNGSVASTVKFINELYKSLPVSEVTNIEVNSSRAVLNTVFYYKPFPPQSVNENIALSPLTKNDLDIIKDISSWNNPKTFEQIQSSLRSSPASSSAF